ncbi:MAG: transposase [Lachnospiraceae bacterium]|nr:transposase [Lachnospiraceae bacterium]
MSRTASGLPKTKQVKRLQKNGDTYIYEVTTKYNPDKRYNEHVSSKLIGKILKGGEEIVSTRPRRSTKCEKPKAVRKTVGVTDILDWIGRESGIDSDLLLSTDKGTAQKIMSIARFWMANPDKSIRRIEEWQIDHCIPYTDGMSEDMCYMLMKELGRDVTTSQSYFRCRAVHTSSRASIAVDTTTVSSYSENLNDVRFGYNKDGNSLAAVKLLTLFDVESHQPIAFSRQPGNIPDVISVLNTLKQLSVFSMEKPLLVLDGGFFSESNILAFIRARTKFLMRGQVDSKWILPELESVDGIEKASNICPFDPDIYGTTCRISHGFTWERTRSRGGSSKGDTVYEEHRLYLHFFLNTDRARIERASLNTDILRVKEQLERGVDQSLLSDTEKRIVKKFLILKERGGSLSVKVDDDAVKEASKYYGYFVLVSNEKQDTFKALKEYRLRERTEEGFRIDKQYNDAHVTRSKSTASLEGRFFCQFVAYGYEEYFRQQLSRLKDSLAVPNGDPEHDNSETFRKEKSLLSWLNKMSVAKLFDWFDTIQETTVDTKIGKARWRTETIERDRLFLQKLGVLKA